ncbi:HTH domain-containing protein [Helicobacter sp. UBA3407]|nr:HTH domain-containing protein [Helicobacter sp. UBA3407]
MKQGHDTLAMRLALILKKLISGERFTIEDLSREFGVSKRTIQRDLNERFNF